MPVARCWAAANLKSTRGRNTFIVLLVLLLLVALAQKFRRMIQKSGSDTFHCLSAQKVKPCFGGKVFPLNSLVL